MMKTPVLLFSLAALLPAALVAAPAADAPWRIGLAAVRITPDQPVLMYGYAGRKEPHARVTSDLYAKALALQDPDGQRAVLVTCDLGSVHGDMIERIAKRLEASHRLPRHAILFNASHTHAGPWAWVANEEIDGHASPAVAATRAYVKKLEQQLETVATDALSRMETGRLSWGLGVATFVMNRRQFTDKGIILGANPKGPVDRSVLVLRADDASGKPRAVVMGAACHCTCTGSKYTHIDGDYAGYAQSALQAQNPGVQAMFMAGCGGDANPWPRGDISNARAHGGTLAAEVMRVMADKLEPVRPPLRTVFRNVALPVAPPAAREQLAAMTKSSSSWERYIGGRQLAILQRGQTPRTSFPMPVSVWQFGADLTLVGLGGEPVNEYVQLIGEAIGPMRQWVAGYCNDVFGYVPTTRILKDGGYESRGIDRGDAVGQFTPGVEHVVVGAVREMAREAGRPGT